MIHHFHLLDLAWVYLIVELYITTRSLAKECSLLKGAERRLEWKSAMCSIEVKAKR